MRCGEVERRPIAGRQQFFLAMAASVPHRTDDVNDMPGGKPISARDLCRAGRAAAERLALRAQFGTGRAMDRAINATAAKQRVVCRIHDCASVVMSATQTSSRAEPISAASSGAALLIAEIYHAHSAFTSARRSIVLFTPMSPKCSSRNRRAARRPLTRNISKKS
jgi:hypothetical protein